MPRQKAKLPHEFPGDFFVLRWDRDRGAFVLHLDDEHRSSHDLGSDIPTILSLLELRGFTKFMRETAVDYAREFGAAQCIPSTGRVIQILPRTPKTRPHLKFRDDDQHNHHEWHPAQT